jgi:hypothetical protein
MFVAHMRACVGLGSELFMCFSRTQGIMSDLCPQLLRTGVTGRKKL